ncbi:hypothetical protein ACGFX4_04970 [Kitasatospora sp. NPDC048365]|uniref:hypothetical protein n=1 Tax=Kitasatospora sp. NPDC048365 TaxID=3364050 RepID=UPI00371DFC7D
MVRRRWVWGQAGYWLVVAAGAGAVAAAVDTAPPGAVDGDDLLGPALAQLAVLLCAGLAVLVAVVWLVAWWRLRAGRGWALAAALLAFPVAFMMAAVAPGAWELPALVGLLVVPALGLVAVLRDAEPRPSP